MSMILHWAQLELVTAQCDLCGMYFDVSKRCGGSYSFKRCFRHRNINQHKIVKLQNHDLLQWFADRADDPKLADLPAL